MALLEPDLTSLDELLAARHPDNPKDHDIGAYIESIKEFGYVDRAIRNEVTKTVLGGHGGIEALSIMKASGETAPDGVLVNGQDEWMIPTDWIAVPIEKELPLIAALNRIGERGGWNEVKLAQVLTQIASDTPKLLVSSGFDAEDLQGILTNLAIKTEHKDAQPPAEFASFDEDIPTEHSCPRCGYSWSGKG